MKTTLNLTISDEELIRAAWKNTPLGRSDSPADKELIEEIIDCDLNLSKNLQSHGWYLIGRSINCPNEIQTETTHFYLFKVDSMATSGGIISQEVRDFWRDGDGIEVHLELLNMNLILAYYSIA